MSEVFYVVPRAAHEALVTAVPGIKFGFAFCESSGKRLIRWTGTDEAMVDLARRLTAMRTARGMISTVQVVEVAQ